MDFNYYLFIGSRKFCKMTKLEEGNTIDLGSNCLFVNKDQDNILKSQNKLISLGSLGKDYENVYITHIPSLEVEYCSTDNYHKLIPEMLQLPMIKTSSDETYDSIILCSGRRSAIIKDKSSSKIFRLKGCGNLYDGFTLGKVLEINENHYEIFGTQFKNTCLREQYVNKKLNSILTKEYPFISLGNIPIGFWIYPHEQSIYDKIGKIHNEKPYIDKYCGLFETNGERRLGEHLLKGVNILISSFLLNDEYVKLLFDKIINLSQVSTKLEGKNYTINNNKVEIIFNDNIQLDDTHSNKLLFDLCSYLHSNSSSNSDITSLETKILTSLINNLLDKTDNNLTVKYSNEINQLVSSLNKTISNKGSLFNLLITVLSKIGFECGRIKRVFEKIDLNWGTYDYHCNAHLDNFMILDKNDKLNYLAPLDFDLAFFREDFIDIKYNKNHTNNNCFDDLITSEKSNLQIQLCGINPIVNIDVELFGFNNDGKYQKDYKAEVESLRNLLIENLNYYFNIGYTYDKHDEENILKINALDSRYEEGVLLIKTLLVLIDG